eukprot:702269-Hanusia_phi.AAC.7
MDIKVTLQDDHVDPALLRHHHVQEDDVWDDLRLVEPLQSLRTTHALNHLYGNVSLVALSRGERKREVGGSERREERERARKSESGNMTEGRKERGGREDGEAKRQGQDK